MKGCLWYPSEELVALAFFDDAKHHMATALQTSGSEHLLKRAAVERVSVETKQLEDFITLNTNRFFSIIGLPSTSLTKKTTV